MRPMEANVPLMSLVCVTIGPIPIGQLLESELFHLINKKKESRTDMTREKKRVEKKRKIKRIQFHRKTIIPSE